MNSAVRWTMNAVEVQHQRALSSAVWPKQCNFFTPSNRKIHATERFRSIGVAEMQVGDRNGPVASRSERRIVRVVVPMAVRHGEARMRMWVFVLLTHGFSLQPR